MRNSFGWENSVVTSKTTEGKTLEIDDSVFDGEIRTLQQCNMFPVC